MLSLNTAIVAKTREPKNEQLCNAVQLIDTYHKCNTNPLDLSKAK